MKEYRIELTPLSAFGSLLSGDTLFGQMCWAIANRYGEERLRELLVDYSTHPFAVCSDGFPNGYLPRPSLPIRYFTPQEGDDRKVIKKKRWIPKKDTSKPLSQWLHNAKSDKDLVGENGNQQQPHNSINRLTGTTGGDMFAPYHQPQTWYQSDTRLDIYLLLDEMRLLLAEIKTIFIDIGTFGYGRDASIGLGKFECTNFSEWNFPLPEEANACMTLAPCAPQGLGLDNDRSYYNVFTRFGRHGDVAAHKQHGPFKAPVLLADTAAVFSPMPLIGQRYLGQALGGNGELSRTIPATVHQGYAPYIPVHLSAQQQETA